MCTLVTFLFWSMLFARSACVIRISVITVLLNNLCGQSFHTEMSSTMSTSVHPTSQIVSSPVADTRTSAKPDTTAGTLVSRVNLVLLTKHR